MRNLACDIAIVGAGPAGLTAALYAVRAGFSVRVYEMNSAGGQMLTAHKIENYPGFGEISGMDLADAMLSQAEQLGAEIVYEAVLSVIPCESGFEIALSDRSEKCRAVIVATGTRYRKLEVAGENELTGRGVSYCAVCDGRFFTGRDVAVVGGGNTAISDALLLSKFCKSVTILHRRSTFRAEQVLVDRLSACENVRTLMNVRVDKIVGEARVESLDIVSTAAESLSDRFVLPVDGVFVAVGSVPVTAFLSGIQKLKIDDGGYIVTDEHCATSVRGLYAAGDTRSKNLRQITTAVADGAIAAVEAVDYLNAVASEGGVNV